MSEWKHFKAQDVMTSPVTVIQARSALDEALQVLTDEEIGALVCVDVRGQPVGVISHTDVAAFLAGVEREADALGDFYFEHLPMWQRIRGSLSGDLSEQEDLLRKTLVSDLMTPEVVGVEVDAPLGDAVDLMRRRRIHRVVVTRGGRAVGVVTTMDVLDALEGVAKAKGS